jgi:CO/xanthine dehydrogenase FAD-binding subunit
MSSTATVTTARSLDEALGALSAGARVVAGGTDLVVGARQGKAPLPDALVAIHRVDALRGITTGTTGSSDGGLRIGSLVTHEELAAHEGIRASYSAIADASAIVGSHATRATGTIGGNVMNASPAMELGGPLICLGANAVLESVRGSRVVAIESLFSSPGRTVAEADELLVAVELPAAPSAGSGSCYARLEYRRQMEIAVVGATAQVSMTDGVITAARVAMTALAPTIRRVPEAEAILSGARPDRSVIDAAARALAAASKPISDVRASETYRRAMAAVIARRVIEGAIARATVPPVAIPASSSLRGAR